MTKRTSLFCGAALAALAATSQALAQSATPATASPAPAVPTQASGSHGNGIEEVVVTARRRSERLQKVPVSVVAFSNKGLTERSIKSGFQLDKAVGGLAVTPQGGDPGGPPSFSIRGRGQNYGAASGSVETYFAEIPLSAPFEAPTLPPQFFDMSSLQVLKGPQGTLFGRNTTGGAVLLVPQAPTDTLSGYGRLQGGTYGDFQAEGAVNIPIVQDKADLRLAGFVWKQDGYMHDKAGTNAETGQPLGAEDYFNHNEWDLRATLRVKPTDDFENSTLFTYHWDQEYHSSGPGVTLKWSGCPSGTLFFGCTFVPGFNPATAVATSTPSPGAGGRTSPASIDLYHPPSHAWALVNTSTYNINDYLTFKNIFGYVNASGYTADGENVSGSSLAGLFLPYAARPRQNEQFTDEVQLQGHLFDNRLSWILGGLYDKTNEPNGRDDMNVASTTFSSGPVPPGGVPYSTVQQAFFAENVNSESAYASATYKITSQISLSGGFRETWNHVIDNIVPSQVVLVPNDPQPLANSFLRNDTPVGTFALRDSGSTYNVTADYQITPDALVYAGFRHGFKRDGFQPSAPPNLVSFGPEKVDSFSIGEKTSFHVGDMPVRLNVEGFYDFYKGLQVSYLTISESPAGVKLQSVTTNIPKTVYRGFDGDISFEPMPWLVVSGNYTYIDAFNTYWPDHTVPGETQNLAPNPVPYQSRNKLSFTGRFHVDLANDMGELVAAPSVNTQSTFYVLPIGTITPLAEQPIFGKLNSIALGGATVPGYTTLDLRLEWNHFYRTKFDLALNFINLTNKVYYIGNNGNLGIGVQGQDYGPPMEFTFDVSTHF